MIECCLLALLMFKLLYVSSKNYVRVLIDVFASHYLHNLIPSVLWQRLKHNLYFNLLRM